MGKPTIMFCTTRTYLEIVSFRCRSDITAAFFDLKASRFRLVEVRHSQAEVLGVRFSVCFWSLVMKEWIQPCISPSFLRMSV